MKRKKEVRAVRLSLVVDEIMWKALRQIAESERSERGRASINALVNRVLAEYLAKRKNKGE